MTDTELLVEIRDVLATSPFVGEGHRKVWARLRRRGVCSSRKRVLRLTRGAGLLAPTGGRDLAPAIRPRRASGSHRPAIGIGQPTATA